MKSLFKKIGKGLSNIGKAIGKVFNSKTRPRLYDGLTQY